MALPRTIANLPVLTIARVATFVICSTIGISSAAAQWQKLRDFESGVSAIYFVDLEGGPSLGFVGLWNGELWRTSDAGATWTQIIVSGMNAYVTGISFKDSKTGWLSTGFYSGFYPGAQGFVYKTTDGGLTWIAVTSRDTWSSVHYNPGNKLLLASSWGSGGSILSADEGTTWQVFHSGSRLNGYSFSDDTHGIVSILGGSFMTTSDGGFNWVPANLSTECWYPLAIPNTSMCFAISEATGQVFRSDDYGTNWSVVYAGFQGSFGDGPTGYIQLENDGVLSIQTHNQGLLVSSDQGRSWTTIGGPKNEYDTRFFGKCNYIFAGEGTDIQTGSLWRYLIPDVSGATRPQARFRDTSGTNTVNVHAGDTLSIALDAGSPIAATTNPQTLLFNFELDSNFLDPVTVIPSPGWTLRFVGLLRGIQTVSLARMQGPTVAVGTPLAELRYRAMLTSSRASKFVLASAEYSDSAETGICGIFPDFFKDTMSIRTVDRCGDSLIRSSLGITSSVRAIGIYPNPVTRFPSNRELAQLALSVKAAARVRLVLIDELGATISDLGVYDLHPGDQTIPLMIDRFGSRKLEDGMYYIRIEAESSESVVKFVIRRER